MQTAGAYIAVARSRRKELPTRLALALFIGGSAFALAPSAWPVIWFLAVCVGQSFDWFCFRAFRLEEEPVLTTSRRLSCLGWSAANSAIYSMIALHLWAMGGQPGQIFALVLVAGSLLHVTLHMNDSRELLFAAALPHLAYFLGLPAVAALTSARVDAVGAVVVFVGSILYVSHLVVAVRQASLRGREIRAAHAAANIERLRAEQASAAKSDFLAAVSHEIRTPLNAVVAAAHLLRRTELTPQQDEHVSILLDGGEALLGIVNDVLDVSKIEAGKMTLEEADVDLPAKLASLVRLWSPRAEDKGLALRVEGLDDLPRRVRTDPLRLQQVLFNLLSNAVKFTERGEVALTAGRLDDENGARLWFEVSDTGCGIPEDALSRVFDCFEQADAGTTRRYGGTGLGLAISRRLAELMGGSMSVRSVAGAGSVFRLEVPCVLAAAPSPAADQAAPTEQAPTADLRVLIAEDHEVNRRIVALLLEPLGWKLVFAVNGREAVDIARAQAFDVILMDMQMPEMNGLEATSAIRAGTGPNLDAPVVALTANALDHHRAAWADIGVDVFVSKPIDPSVLTAAVLNAVAARPVRAAAA